MIHLQRHWGVGGRVYPCPATASVFPPLPHLHASVLPAPDSPDTIMDWFLPGWGWPRPASSRTRAATVKSVPDARVDGGVAREAAVRAGEGGGGQLRLCQPTSRPGAGCGTGRAAPCRG